MKATYLRIVGKPAPQPKSNVTAMQDTEAWKRRQAQTEPKKGA
jgi:hypothetical protein